MQPQTSEENLGTPRKTDSCKMTLLQRRKPAESVNVFCISLYERVVLTLHVVFF